MMKNFMGFASLHVVSVSLGLVYSNLNIDFLFVVRKPMMMGTLREYPFFFVANSYI
jgi:hypothetical protein